VSTAPQALPSNANRKSGEGRRRIGASRRGRDSRPEQACRGRHGCEVRKQRGGGRVVASQAAPKVRGGRTAAASGDGEVLRRSADSAPRRSPRDLLPVERPPPPRRHSGRAAQRSPGVIGHRSSASPASRGRRKRRPRSPNWSKALGRADSSASSAAVGDEHVAAELGRCAPRACAGRGRTMQLLSVSLH